MGGHAALRKLHHTTLFSSAARRRDPHQRVSYAGALLSELPGMQEKARGGGGGRGRKEERRHSEAEEFHLERPARPGGRLPKSRDPRHEQIETSDVWGCQSRPGPLKSDVLYN